MDSTLVSKNDPAGIGRSPLWQHLVSVERRYIVPNPNKPGGDPPLLGAMAVLITERHGSREVEVSIDEWDSTGGCWRIRQGSVSQHEEFAAAYRTAWGLWLGLAMARGWQAPAE